MEKSVQIIANSDLSGEANGNLSCREFLSDMEKMGFFSREEEYFSKTFYHPLDDVEVEVCVSDPEHLNKFPFDKW